jgi:hypothetical protein
LRILHAHTLTCLLNGSAHETQSFSTKLRETEKMPQTLSFLSNQW